MPFWRRYFSSICCWHLRILVTCAYKFEYSGKFVITINKLPKCLCSFNVHISKTIFPSRGSYSGLCTHWASAVPLSSIPSSSISTPGRGGISFILGENTSSLFNQFSRTRFDSCQWAFRAGRCTLDGQSTLVKEAFVVFYKWER